jgi:V/A-type H+-transporting ATPase subunit K
MFELAAELSTVAPLLDQHVAWSEESAAAMGENIAAAAAAIAVGLAAFGAGYAERGIGAAAVGAMAENEDLFGKGLILTVLPETLVILALVVVFVV